MATKKTKKVAVKAERPGKRLPRCAMTARILCEDTRKFWTLNELISVADKRHAELGGKRNIKEATFSAKRAVSICRAIGLAEMCEGKIRVIGKVV
ncbi:MAG: hypothetical protein GXY55_01400 [Phycisphaerae bacterium]|nr:hypothetical protein [Phycisphaerae bacterium]